MAPVTASMKDSCGSVTGPRGTEGVGHLRTDQLMLLVVIQLLRSAIDDDDHVNVGVHLVHVQREGPHFVGR